jgi:tellurite resistance protein
MSTRPQQSLLEKIAKKLAEPASFAPDVPGSLLSLAGERYGNRSLDDDITQPTGFDPQAAALFEALVESAFLVAHADGEFDEVEQEAFRVVVLAACAGKVAEPKLEALLADLADLIEEDGIDKRIQMVAKAVTRREQALEVLRVGALVAQVSSGVSEVEREVLEKLSKALALDEGAVAETLAEVERALHE